MNVTPGLVVLTIGGLMMLSSFAGLLATRKAGGPDNVFAPGWVVTAGLLGVLVALAGCFMLTLR